MSEPHSKLMPRSQKQKDQLQLRDEEISGLKKLIAEIREKKREYIG